MLRANWDQHRGGTLTHKLSDQPGSAQGSTSHSADPSSPFTKDSANSPHAREDDAASIEPMSPGANESHQGTFAGFPHLPPTRDAEPHTRLPGPLPSHAVRSRAGTASVATGIPVSRAAPGSAASSRSPLQARSLSSAAQSDAASLQRTPNDITFAAASSLAVPKAASARPAYHSAGATAMSWEDVEEVFDRNWHGGSELPTQLPATAAGSNSLPLASAARTPRKR